MRGSIKQRSPGSWTLIIDLGYEPDPRDPSKLRRKQKWQTFRGPRKKAEDRLNELLGQVRTGQYVDPSKMTVGQWLAEWIENVKPTVRPASFTRYSGIVQNHLLKAGIGAIPIQKLRASHIEAYYADVPIGSRPVHNTVLRRALRKAVKEHLLALNPAADLDHAPRRPKASTEDARSNCWSAAEARTFLAAAKEAGAQAAALYTVALDSGARKGELCGLRWEDVEFSAGALRIVRQLTKP